MVPFISYLYPLSRLIFLATSLFLMTLVYHRKRIYYIRHSRTRNYSFVEEQKCALSFYSRISILAKIADFSVRTMM